MKTTVELPDPLLRAAKAMAARRGTTLKAIITHALEREVHDGHAGHPGGPGSPEDVRPLLERLRSVPGHVFWEDSISVADSRALPSLRGVTSKQLTDVYLLALAVHRGGGFASLDARIDPSRIPRGPQALVLIPH